MVASAWLIADALNEPTEYEQAREICRAAAESDPDGFGIRPYFVPSVVSGANKKAPFTGPFLVERAGLEPATPSLQTRPGRSEGFA